jgi:energy-coupling factor transporter ATP-binding protein EcfA2
VQDPLFKVGKEQLLQSLSVERLFGRFSYSIPFSQQPYPNLTILYGRNGSGKTTLLRLLFDVLYPSAGDMKNNLANTPFNMLSVRLSNGILIRVQRDGDRLIGPFTIDLFDGDTRLDPLRYNAPTDPINRKSRGPFTPQDAKEEAEMDAYTQRLRRYGYSISFLDSYRQLATTDTSMTRMTRELAWRRRNRERIMDGEGFEDEDFFARLPILAAMEGAWRRIQSLGRIRGNAADWEANDRFAAMVRSVAFDTPNADVVTEKRADAIMRLREQAAKSRRYALVGLATEFDPEPLIESIHAAPPERLSAVLTLVTTYLESQDARMRILDRLYSTISEFTTSLNVFYEGGKSVSFSMSDGIRIAVREKLLEPDLLSSGEQHLMLLFCNKLSFAERTGILLIDEPELSLNTEWQRMLLSYLLKGRTDDSLQFVLATHSFEILSQYEGSVVELPVDDSATSEA